MHWISPFFWHIETNRALFGSKRQLLHFSCGIAHTKTGHCSVLLLSTLQKNYSSEGKEGLHAVAIGTSSQGVIWFEPAALLNFSKVLARLTEWIRSCRICESAHISRRKYCGAGVFLKITGSDYEEKASLNKKAKTETTEKLILCRCFFQLYTLGSEAFFWTFFSPKSTRTNISKSFFLLSRSCKHFCTVSFALVWSLAWQKWTGNSILQFGTVLFEVLDVSTDRKDAILDKSVPQGEMTKESVESNNTIGCEYMVWNRTPGLLSSFPQKESAAGLSRNQQAIHFCSFVSLRVALTVCLSLRNVWKYKTRRSALHPRICVLCWRAKKKTKRYRTTPCRCTFNCNWATMNRLTKRRARRVGDWKILICSGFAIAHIVCSIDESCTVWVVWEPLIGWQVLSC